MGQPNYSSSATAIATAQTSLDTLVANGATATATGVGTVFGTVSTVISSNIVTAGVDITGVSSGGQLELVNMFVQTNSTGLATGTLLNIVHNNVKGLLLFFSTVITGLGANKTITLAQGSVVGAGFVLETGKKLTAKSTGLDCTGAGTVDIICIWRRLAAGATIAAV